MGWVRWSFQASIKTVGGVLEVHQNPHPTLSHNKMWEREKKEPLPQQNVGEGEERASPTTECGRGCTKTYSRGVARLGGGPNIEGFFRSRARVRFITLKNWSNCHAPLL